MKKKTWSRSLSLLLTLSMGLAMLAGCGSAGSNSANSAGSSSAGSASSTSSSATQVETMAGDEFGNGAVGTHGGVSSSHPLASQIGLEILEKGGNAIDAAVATAFAVGVLEPQYSGIGGAGLMTIYLNDEDRYTTLEYLETSPAAIEPGWYNEDTDKYTAKNAAVPSQVHGLLTALEEYGTMSREEVMAPAIELARNGFPVSQTLGTALLDTYDRISASEAASSVYAPDGLVYSVGDTMTNVPLADVLQKIADGGIEEFYTGELAEQIVAGLQAGGSLITMEDMANYTTMEREPISTNYFGYDVITVSAPSNGGTMLLETLNILENYDLKSMGQNSFEYLLTMGDAMRIGWVDSYTALGDPAFFDLPIEKMISKEFAKERLADMPVDGVSQYIDEKHPTADLVSTPVGEAAAESQHTTHISVIDQYGNIVSTTNTLGNSFGCSYMIDGMGFFFNSHVGNMEHDPEKSDSPDYIMPGKRVRSTMAPTIVVKDGEPVMAIGSPGSLAIPPAIITVLNNVLLFDMDLQEAINAPRGLITTRSKPYSKMTIEADRMDPEVISQLEASGYTLDNKGEYDTSLGGIAAIYLKDGKIYAGADPRRGYQAYAY